MKKAFLTTVTIILTTNQVSAVINALPATPNVNALTNAEYVLQEVSFKDKNADWFTFIVNSSKPNQKINLKGTRFVDDYAFKTIENDHFVYPEQLIKVTFNSTKEDTNQEIHVKKKGLTGTTEQLIIETSSGQIADATCWTTPTPTEAEIKDMNKLFEQKGWTSPLPSSCIPSLNIKKGDTIKRIRKSNHSSSDDWKINTMNNNFDQKQEAKKDGDLNPNIRITEILPNPEGTDGNKEWVEITNYSSYATNLNGWQIDDSEDGSKPYTLPPITKIEAYESIIIEKSQSKLSLGNKEDKIRLFDFNSNLIDLVSYQKAPEGSSFSLHKIITPTNTLYKWFWNPRPTPGSKNETYISTVLEITNTPQFKDVYSFTALNKDKKTTVIFTENVIPAPMAKAFFKPDTKILALLKSLDVNSYQLLEYKIIDPLTPNNKDSYTPYIISSILLTVIITFTLIKSGIFRLNHKQSEK
ncbi:hypothetical protein GF340_00625 [Candidatus Peregrinibacteria bacterium]|nr:hypothetical protein [Candidatus Peregrinibacteria bacterium]